MDIVVSNRHYVARPGRQNASSWPDCPRLFDSLGLSYTRTQLTAAAALSLRYMRYVLCCWDDYMPLPIDALHVVSSTRKLKVTAPLAPSAVITNHRDNTRQVLRCFLPHGLPVWGNESVAYPPASRTA